MYQRDADTKVDRRVLSYAQTRLASKSSQLGAQPTSSPSSDYEENRSLFVAILETENGAKTNEKASTERVRQLAEEK